MNQKISRRGRCNDIEAKGICQDVRVALCHAEPFGKTQGKLREASALRLTNSLHPAALKNRFFVATLLRMTYENKRLIGALRAPVRSPDTALWNLGLSVRKFV
jgi:hypothetical protein